MKINHSFMSFSTLTFSNPSPKNYMTFSEVKEIKNQNLTKKGMFVP
jgi:hypothetical protein